MSEITDEYFVIRYELQGKSGYAKYRWGGSWTRRDAHKEAEATLARIMSVGGTGRIYLAQTLETGLSHD